MFGQRRSIAGSNAGVKRPFDGADLRPMKVHRPVDASKVQAKKDARKEANAERLAFEDEEYTKIAHEIAPLVASIIDSFGGVSTLSVIATDENLKNALDQVPAGHSKKLKKILEMFPEHIVCLEDGHVVTALGYENGIVSAEGIVDKEKKQNFAKNKKENDKKTVCVERPEDRSGPRLQRALARIAVVGAKEPEKPYQDALMELNNARLAAFRPTKSSGVKLAINKADPQKTDRDCRQFAQYVRRFMINKGYKAGVPMKMSEIASDTEAKNMHAQIVRTSGKKHKMGKIITDHPQFFLIERNEAIGASEITLTAEGASVAQQSKSFGSKGKGKGKRF